MFNVSDEALYNRGKYDPIDSFLNRAIVMIEDEKIKELEEKLDMLLDHLGLEFEDIPEKTLPASRKIKVKGGNSEKSVQ